ncbi:MAG: rRNA maturation RNase YbeY [Caldilineaceae bacterium]|nr:rRNA maturation RNase YbeY [Caldilineaceae bacterium]
MAVIARTLQRCAQPEAALTLVLTDNAAVQQLNRDYRGVDAPTDVLSFSNQEDVDSAPPAIHGLPDEISAALNQYLGDIIIAYPYAVAQAATYKNSVGAELRLLTVHGVLHLLGYDHGTSEEEAAMWALQREILTPFGDADLTNRSYE